MIKKFLAVVVLSALAMGLSACQTNASVSVTQATDEAKLPASPQKIAVMDFGAMDTLDALGAGRRIIVAPISNMPTYLHQYLNRQLHDSGKMKEPDIAAIRAAKPDLIIMSGRQNAFAKELESIAPTLNYSVKTDSNYFANVQKQILLLGKLAGQEALAQQQLQALALKINAARELAEHSTQKAIIVLHNDGKVMLMNQGSYSALIFDELKIKRALKIDELPVQQSSKDGKPTRLMVDNSFITQYHPDIVYVVDRSKAIGNTPMRNDYFDSSVLQRAGTRVVYLSADLWYLSGNGLESLNQQIDEVVKPLNDIN
ncbi:ABC transporter substrate-binding protein [Snodgrassella alvi]|uniref:ABC transporter substrate-binding protein n=1 Tax=Snodgrassella alvi TaxID=1196083 RepID=UPI00352DC3A4